MSENEQENKKVATSNIDIKFWAAGSFLFIFMSVFGYLAYLNLHFPLTDRGNYATLGDSFGVLSSLFSGLAFAGLIVTIVMQNKTMKAQMEELELARKEYQRQGDELQGQKDVMNKQFEAIQIQQFETTFFKLIDNHRSIISSYSLALGDPETNGKYVNGFEYIKSVYKKVGNIGYLSNTEVPNNKTFYKFYYCGISRIIDFIKKSFNYNEKHEKYLFYINIFKVYISSEEMTCLYFLIYRLKNEVYYDEDLFLSGLFDDFELDGFLIEYPHLCNSSLLGLRMDIFNIIYEVGVGNNLLKNNSFFSKMVKIKKEYEDNLFYHMEGKDYSIDLKNYDSEIDKVYKYMCDNFPVEDLIDLHMESPAFLRKYRIGECENAFKKDLVVSKEYYFSLKEHRQRIVEEKKEFEYKRDNLNYCINMMNQILSCSPLTPSAS